MKALERLLSAGLCVRKMLLVTVRRMAGGGVVTRGPFEGCCKNSRGDMSKAWTLGVDV